MAATMAISTPVSKSHSEEFRRLSRHSLNGLVNIDIYITRIEPGHDVRKMLDQILELALAAIECLSFVSQSCENLESFDCVFDGTRQAVGRNP